MSTIFLSIFMWIVLGTVIFHVLEPWTWIQSFYFAVSSLTTVGYGDLVPSNDMTRLVTSLYLLVGVGVVIASLGIAGRYYMTAKERRFLSRGNGRKDPDKKKLTEFYKV